MPYFFWIGINFEGIICKGHKFAQSILDLDNKLLKEDIGLIKAKEKKKFKFEIYAAQQEKNNVINHLAILLKANIRINQALKIIRKNVKNSYLKSVLEDIEFLVYQGYFFSQALENHANIFDELTCAIVSAGEKSTNLAQAIELLNQHNQELSRFNQKLRSVLLAPILTFLFFLAVLFCLFFFVIPRFEIFFSSFDISQYRSTRFVISMSQFIRSSYFLIFIFLIIIIYFLIKMMAIFVSKNLKSEARSFFSQLKDKFCIYIPLFGKLNLLIYHYRFLQTLSILLSSNVHLVDALQVTINTIKNSQIQKVLCDIIDQVKAGRSLSYSLSRTYLFSNEELIALINIGESSSNLVSLVAQASQIYQIRVYQMINKLVMLLQPTLLIILGLLIAGLIFSIYIPIFTLTSVIH